MCDKYSFVIEAPALPEDMLNSDIKIEKEVAVKYGEAAKTLNDPKLKNCLHE
jgi:rubrerythrin